MMVLRSTRQADRLVVVFRCAEKASYDRLAESLRRVAAQRILTAVAGVNFSHPRPPKAAALRYSSKAYVPSSPRKAAAAAEMINGVPALKEGVLRAFVHVAVSLLHDVAHALIASHDDDVAGGRGGGLPVFVERQAVAGFVFLVPDAAPEPAAEAVVGGFADNLAGGGEDFAILAERGRRRGVVARRGRRDGPRE